MSNQGKNYKCVIFDCDGVLVDSEPIGNRVMVEMANALGAVIDLEYAYQHFKGNSLYTCMNHIERLITKKLPVDFEAQYRKTTFERFKDDIKPVEGILELVQSLKVPFCVASSGPEAKIRLNLELTGLLPYFEDKIFSCYAINKWKPDPDIFIWAAKAMGFDRTECVVIEDSIHGIEAATRGGFDVFAYTAHDYADELQKKATKSFDSMLNLKEMLMV